MQQAGSTQHAQQTVRYDAVEESRAAFNAAGEASSTHSLLSSSISSFFWQPVAGSAMLSCITAGAQGQYAALNAVRLQAHAVCDAAGHHVASHTSWPKPAAVRTFMLGNPRGYRLRCLRPQQRRER